MQRNPLSVKMYRGLLGCFLFIAGLFLFPVEQIDLRLAHILAEDPIVGPEVAKNVWEKAAFDSIAVSYDCQPVWLPAQ